MVDDPVCLLDSDGGIREWNHTFEELIVPVSDDLRGRPIHDLVTEDDMASLRSALEEATDSGSAMVSTTMTTAESAQQPVQLTVTRMALNEDEVTGFTVIARPASEWLDVAHEPDMILDRMADAFFALDREWRLTYVNDRAREILSEAMIDSIDTDSMIGLHLWEAIPEAVGTTFYEQYHAAMERQEPVSFEAYYAPMETWFEVRAYPSPTGLSVYFRDVTEQRHYREMIETRERVLHEMHAIVSDSDRSFDEQVEALMTMGRDVLDTEFATLSRITDETYVFEAVQSPNDEIEPGETISLNVTNCERVVSNQRTLSIGDINTEMPELAARAGNEQWNISCYIGAPIIVDGEIYGTFCFYGQTAAKEQFSEWDATLVDLMARWIGYELNHRRTTEELKRQNERLEDFASIVSHDLRNPINVVRGSIELAEDTDDHEHFERAYRTIDRMEQLIDDLLVLAREGDTIDTPEPVDLTELIDQCWATIESHDAKLHRMIDRTIKADQGRLRQLLENLFDNAVEHGGDDVTVTIGELPDGFYIEDDGPGIPAEDREQVFDAGYTTADDGTGFGLRIVKEIVEAHRWTITVAEGDDGGARFEITGVDFA